jgi:hypothetical protein
VSAGKILRRSPSPRGLGSGRPRGFTMIELAIAGALLLLVSGVLGLAVAQAVGSRNESVIRSQLSSDIVQGESSIANGSYASVLGNTFAVPSPCSTGTGAGVGTNGQSCYQVGPSTYKVTWGITTSGTSTTIVLGGTTTLASGVIVSESRIIKAPSYEYSAGNGVVRVSVVNDPPGWNGAGPLYLLEQNNPTIVVASGPVSNGVAVLQGNPAQCTLTNPCVLGLASGHSFASNGIVTEVPSEVWGSGSGVTLTAGGLTDATVTLTGIGTATLNLNATNTTTGQSGANSVAGSVCLYLNFNDGVAQQSVPVCNFATAGSVTVGTYNPDPANLLTVVPIPVGVPITLSTDASNGGCPYVTNSSSSGPAGTQGYNGSTWAAVAVCTSWTWGNPTNSTIGGISAGWSASTLTLTAGSTVAGTINWTGPGLGSSTYVADTGNNNIRIVGPGGTSAAWAGNGHAGLVNGTSSGAEFSSPGDVAVGKDGIVYVADTNNDAIREISPGGAVTTLATGFLDPSGVALNSTGTTLYVADSGHNQIDAINLATSAVSVLAGNGLAGSTNGAGSSSSFNDPQAIAYYSGTLYVADTGNNEIRAITATGVVSTFVGSTTPGHANGTSASFSGPSGIAIDSSGDIFISDTGNNEIREATLSGTVSTFSGQLTPGLVNGAPGSAKFSSPWQISVGQGSILYVADSGNNVIREITSSGTAFTLSGSGTAGSVNGAPGSTEFSGDLGVGAGQGWVSGQPAIGWGAVSVWSGPRLIQSCSTYGTCTSIGNSVPENTTCPGQDCNSGSAPVSAEVAVRHYAGERARKVEGI